MRPPRKSGALNLEGIKAELFIPVYGYEGYWKRAYISRETELRMIKEAQAGNDQSLKEVVLSQFRLVTRIALLYYESYDSFKDLVQAGLIGVTEAVRRFDTSSGNRLSSYSIWHVRYRIQEAVAQCVGASLGSLISKKKIKNIMEARKSLRSSGLSGEISASLISEITGLPLDLLYILINGSKLEDPPTDIDDGSYDLSVKKMEFYDALGNLSDLERAVIDASFGLVTGNPLRDYEICAQLDLSCETLMEVRDNAIRNFRKYYVVE